MKNEVSREEHDEIVAAYTQDAKHTLMAYFKGERHIDEANFLHHLQLKASGHCSICEEPSPIKRIEKIEKGRRITFECGHGDIALAHNETVTLHDAFRIATVGILVGKCGELLQKVSARISGFKTPKESEEKNLVIRLCKKAKPHLTQFVNDMQNSATDVIASNNSEMERFQVTKLYEERFWERLMVNDHVDFITKGIIELIKEAVARKSKYDKEETRRLILAIDTWPGISNSYVIKIKNNASNLLKACGYKEIWLVGETEEMIVQIF